MKKALCIGINYRGSEYELGGCINDADDWASFLHNLGGFDCAVMAEGQATKRNMIAGIETIATRLKAGDVGVIAYSGHGTWVPDMTGDEPDGRDEALVPIDCDKNLILDDELHTIFEQVPAQAHLVFIADCCHSGTVFRSTSGEAGVKGVRFMPPSAFTHTEVQTAALHKAARMAVTYPLGATDRAFPNVVHFSGCKDDEYSNDVEMNGRPCGAFSYYAIRAFTKCLKGGLTYGDAHKEIAKRLPSPRYQQTPMLYSASPMKRRKLFSA